MFHRLGQGERAQLKLCLFVAHGRRSPTKGFTSAQRRIADQTLGHSPAVASVDLGAVVIEKHFTLSRGDGGQLW